MSSRRAENDNTPLTRDTNNQEDSGSSDSPPPDKYYLCACTFFLIGLAQLLPWNFLVTATNYWMFKFRHLNETVDYSTTRGIGKIVNLADKDKSDLQAVFDSYLAIASNLPFLIVFALSFSQTLKNLNETIKNSAAFICLLVIFATITSFVLINTDQFQDAFLRLTLILVFFLNMVASFIQANFAGLASTLPEQIMRLMVTGQAMSGLFAVAAQILSLAGNWSIVQSTFAYFLFADVVILGTLLIYLLATRSHYIRYYKERVAEITEFYADESTDDSADSSDDSLELSRRSRVESPYKIVFKEMWPYCLTLTLTFFTTLSVYPGVVVLVNPSSAHQSSSADTFWKGKFFLPVCCFLTFNLGDFLGRYLGSFWGYISPTPMMTLAFLRLAFIPAFLFCNVFPRQHLPVLFESELCYVLFMLFFGLSNGFLVVNVFVGGPKQVSCVHSNLAGFFLMLFLGLGLTLGSLFSTVLVRIL